MTKRSTKRDHTSELWVADYVGKAWGVVVHFFGDFNPVDFWMEKDLRNVAFAEIKTRWEDRGAGVLQHSEKYPDVWFAVRKYLPLLLATATMDVEGYFIVRYADRVLYINVLEVDASKLKIVQRMDRGLKNDREPAILVPINQMKEVENRAAND